METKILIVGADTFFGKTLTEALAKRHGHSNVFGDGLFMKNKLPGQCYLSSDRLDQEELKKTIRKHGITQLYLLKGMQYCIGDKAGDHTWKRNVHDLLTALQLSHELQLDRVFWPGSIAVFGPQFSVYDCPQEALKRPVSSNGLSYLAGEHWCAHYFREYGVDIRSLRLPVIIPDNNGGASGLAAYADELFRAAAEGREAACFLAEDRCLPMLYLPDAVGAVIRLMEAKKESITIRTSYNIASQSFAPCDLVAEIRKFVPGFRVAYLPDHRDQIATALPVSVNDLYARHDWNWCPVYNLTRMTADRLKLIRQHRDDSENPARRKARLPAYPDFHTDF